VGAHFDLLGFHRHLPYREKAEDLADAGKDVGVKVTAQLAEKQYCPDKR
jgi:hypothetical protein